MSRWLSLAALAALVGCGGSQSKSVPPPSKSVPPPVSRPQQPPPPARVAPANPDDAPLPLWPAVRTGKLANGLTYFIMKHGKPEKRALLWLAVNAGSVQEDDDQRGLAHFDEHMAFNGTKRFPKSAIIDYLEKIGMRFGADLNAYTLPDETVYQLEVPTDDAQYVKKGFDMLRDWSGGDVSYDPTEIDKERSVVLEERQLRYNADVRLIEKHAKVLFEGTRYADRLMVLGDPEIIKKAPRAALYRFYKDWYRPDEMAVIAVGDFDPAVIEQEIKARFGDLVAPAKERARPSGGAPAATGTRVSIQTDREAQGTTVTVINTVAHRSEASRREYRRALGERLYSSILTQRLAEIAHMHGTPFLHAEADISSVMRDIDGIARTAMVKEGRVDQALLVLLAAGFELERDGITETELERARTKVLRAVQEAADQEATTESRAFASEITRYFFAHEQMIGRAADLQLTKELLPTITIAELTGYARQLGGAENRTIVISGPDGKPLPSKERVLAMVDQALKAKPMFAKARKDATAQQPLLATAPAPGKIVKERKVDKVDVTEWTLSNGVRVVVKPTDFELDAVTLQGSAPGGLATAKDQDVTAARLTAGVEGGGVGELSFSAVKKLLEGKQINVSTSVAETTHAIAAHGSAHDLETMLQLVYLKMTAPRKNPKAFATGLAKVIEGMTGLLRAPEARFKQEMDAALWKRDLRHTDPAPADLEKVDYERAFALYKDRFGDASNFTFVIVGAVDLATLRPLVETYLGSLPAKGRKDKEKDLGAREVGGIVKKEWKLATQPKAIVRLDFHGDETWTRDKERDISILRYAMAIKLREVLRGDLRGVYDVEASGSIVRSPHQRRDFEIIFGCDPASVDALIAATLTLNAAIAKSGVGDDDLEKIKQAYTRETETALRSNDFWLRSLSEAYRFGDDPTVISDSASVLARVTSANIKASAKRYLDAKQYFQAVLLPEPSK